MAEVEEVGSGKGLCPSPVRGLGFARRKFLKI